MYEKKVVGNFIRFLEYPQPYYFDVYNSSYEQNKWLLSCSLENDLHKCLFKLLEKRYAPTQ